MRVITFRKGEKLPDLVNRAFDLKTTEVVANLEHEAIAHLLEANPHLKNVEKVPDGALVIVPEIKGVQSIVEKLDATGAVDQVAGVLMNMLHAAQSALEESADKSAVEYDHSRKLAKSKDLGRLIAKDPALKARLAGIDRESLKRVKEIKDLHKSQLVALKELNQDLKSVAENLKFDLPPRTKDKPEEPPARIKRVVKQGRKAFHVTFDRISAKWRVLEQGKTKPLSVHDTKKEAVERGRKIAKSAQPSQVKIHKRDGKIQEERTYGEDPKRSKG